MFSAGLRAVFSAKVMYGSIFPVLVTCVCVLFGQKNFTEGTDFFVEDSRLGNNIVQRASRENFDKAFIMNLGIFNICNMLHQYHCACFMGTFCCLVMEVHQRSLSNEPRLMIY